MKNIFKKKETVKFYNVQWKFVGDDEVHTEVMDAKSVNCLCIDWNYEVISATLI